MVEERPHDAPHPPQPRRLLRSAPLRSPFPSGARLSARILFVRMTVTVKAMIASVLLALIDKDNRNKPCPAGEGGPQRKKNANTWSDFLTRLRWMRCITRTLFHIFANAIGAELMTQPRIHCTVLFTGRPEVARGRSQNAPTKRYCARNCKP